MSVGVWVCVGVKNCQVKLSSTMGPKFNIVRKIIGAIKFKCFFSLSYVLKWVSCGLKSVGLGLATNKRIVCYCKRTTTTKVIITLNSMGS